MNQYKKQDNEGGHMNELRIFENAEFWQVRTVTINEEPWFVGKDVAGALGYSNHRDTLSKRVDEEDKGVANCDTLGGSQEMVIINESGLYSMIFGSKLESAKRFKHWVTSEVLPSLRKTGSYEMPKKNVPKRLPLSSVNMMVKNVIGTLEKAKVEPVDANGSENNYGGGIKCQKQIFAETHLSPRTRSSLKESRVRWPQPA